MSIIGITTTLNNIEKGYVDLSFGRCEYFLILNTEKTSFEFYENIYKKNKDNAGIDSIEFLKQKGVDMIITGNIGSKVMECIDRYKIRLIIAKENNLKLDNIIKKLKLN
ncbi:MAG: hypothetical protein A2X12_03305 [Bacteroidetes bacterium GWE2_29_8]|nr:MAG: hypothetical protein A2X12_03305 [Bacteroidetes bacterium GWE2_29_8]OFY14135.1 MAG: hypothetical protein A2X02_02570 [Bacteroidetes bacterium GWF2_29_10]